MAILEAPAEVQQALVEYHNEQVAELERARKELEMKRRGV
jgi:hypothetical protein